MKGQLKPFSRETLSDQKGLVDRSVLMAAQGTTAGWLIPGSRSLISSVSLNIGRADSPAEYGSGAWVNARSGSLRKLSGLLSITFAFEDVFCSSS